MSFTCSKCGATGDPPKCDHFMQPWSMEQIAEAHRKLSVPPPLPHDGTRSWWSGDMGPCVCDACVEARQKGL